MIDNKKHVGIGFATGRKSFLNVLRAYIFHLVESNFLVKNNILLSLFVAYDPSYNNTSLKDYDCLSKAEKNVFYHCHYIGPEDIKQEISNLLNDKVITPEEADFCFGSGYAVQRNIIQYQAIKEHVDYLIFLDDDEYPLAVTKSQDTCLWSGQHVLEEHIRYLQFSDFTNGYHCGYLSPLPTIEYDGILTEEIFHNFTDALSSDVLKWSSVQQTIQSGGVTYADKTVLMEHKAQLVPEHNGAKYISGGNLGINLTDPSKILPFFNPPGARGEDSLLSTCITQRNVKKIPIYTFHDGFGFYGSLLKGVLPMELKKISLYDSQTVIDRFYRACIGWIRYKPLYTFLTQPEYYTDILEKSKQNLQKTLEAISAYFNNWDFMQILTELEDYIAKIPLHFDMFCQANQTWKKIIAQLQSTTETEQQLQFV